MKSEASKIVTRLKKLGDPDVAAGLRRFFKTGKGEYGEGDLFLGIRVPTLRRVAADYRNLDLEVLRAVLRSEFHEVRLLALLILVDKYKKSTSKRERGEIYRAYLSNTVYVNNWDLVDLSCGRIVGAHLYERSREPLYRLARSESLWERRIGIVSTSYFIGKNDFEDTISLAEILLDDKEDLMHKASGWMLREVGKRDRRVLDRFLDIHCVEMPRTMLRYALEHHPPGKRKAYMAGRASA